MARFLGRYDLDLGADGLIWIPPKFHEGLQLSSAAASDDGCLQLWPKGEAARLREILAERLGGAGASSLLVNRWSTAALHPVEFGADGAWSVDDSLRSYAQLRKKVLLVGALDRVEVWSPDHWDVTVVPSEALLGEATHSEPTVEVANPSVLLAASSASIDGNARLKLLRAADLLERVSPSGFESLLAEVFFDAGFHVVQTPSSGDGGVDLWIASGIDSPLLVAVQAKRYGTHRKVGVGAVRELWGALSGTAATAGLVVTTSGFTRGASLLASSHRTRHQLALRTVVELATWLEETPAGLTQLFE